MKINENQEDNLGISCKSNGVPFCGKQCGVTKRYPYTGPPGRRISRALLGGGVMFWGRVLLDNHSKTDGKHKCRKASENIGTRSDTAPDRPRQALQLQTSFRNSQTGTDSAKQPQMAPDSPRQP